MPDLIVDTSALIAFFLKREQQHVAAQTYIRTHPHLHWVILESVFDEFVTWARAHISPQASVQLGTILRTEHRYINISDEDDAATWSLFSQYEDKSWSYTDCSILALSRRLDITHVFAFDRHIRQMAGLGIMAVP